MLKKDTSVLALEPLKINQDTRRGDHLPESPLQKAKQHKTVGSRGLNPLEVGSPHKHTNHVTIME